MATIHSRRTWKVQNQKSRASRGPLIRVTHPDGHVSKMYEQDAVDAGLIQGKRPAAPEDKRTAAPEDKRAAGQSNKGGGAPAESPPDDFSTIPGIGPATARSLVAQGVRTFAQLKRVKLDTLELTKSAAEAVEAWRDA